ncbi:hypothetical protein FKM82_024980, partial [Ascaphus truei]
TDFRAALQSSLRMAPGYVRLLCCLGLVWGDASGCIRVNPCKCLMKDGSGVISLARLGDAEGFLIRGRRVQRGEEVSGMEDSATFSPCHPFSEPAGLMNCSHVAVCVVSRDPWSQGRVARYVAFGQHEDNEFNYSNESRVLSVTYRAAPGSPSRTVVHFNCSPTSSVTLPSHAQRPDVLEMFVQSPCICPSSCQAEDVGPGTVILVLFAVSTAVYVLCG